MGAILKFAPIIYLTILITQLVCEMGLLKTTYLIYTFLQILKSYK
jgi:hypothetical protein